MWHRPVPEHGVTNWLRRHAAAQPRKLLPATPGKMLAAQTALTPRPSSRPQSQSRQCTSCGVGRDPAESCPVRPIHAWNRQLSPTCSTSPSSKNTSEQLEPSDPADVSRPSIAAASVGSQKAQQDRHMGWHQRLATERSPRRQLTRSGTGSHCFWPRLTVSGRTQFS